MAGESVSALARSTVISPQSCLPTGNQWFLQRYRLIHLSNISKNHTQCNDHGDCLRMIRSLDFETSLDRLLKQLNRQIVLLGRPVAVGEVVHGKQRVRMVLTELG